jgi:hypothetical protein
MRLETRRLVLFLRQHLRFADGAARVVCLPKAKLGHLADVLGLPRCHVVLWGDLPDGSASLAALRERVPQLRGERRAPVSTERERERERERVYTDTLVSGVSHDAQATQRTNARICGHQGTANETFVILYAIPGVGSGHPLRERVIIMHLSLSLTPPLSLPPPLPLALDLQISL